MASLGGVGERSSSYTLPFSLPFPLLSAARAAAKPRAMRERKARQLRARIADSTKRTATSARKIRRSIRLLLTCGMLFPAPLDQWRNTPDTLRRLGRLAGRTLTGKALDHKRRSLGSVG